MQFPTIDVATIVPVQTGGGVTARVVSGSIAQVPIGALLEATVTSVSPREIALTVNGLPLTVRPPTGIPPFQPGTAILVRVPPAGANAPNPTIELSLPTPANPAPGQNPTAAVAPRVPEGTTRAASTQTGSVPTNSAPTKPLAAVQTTPPLAASRLAVVDVLTPLPDGRLRVQIDGVEQIATAAEPLAPGGRYVLQAERNAAGIRLSPPPPDSPELPTAVATAILRSPAPALPAALKPLQTELAALAAPAPGAPPAVREAAVAVENTLRTFVPTEARPPDAAQLQRLVENGGLHFEAKLARLVEGPNASADLRTASPVRPSDFRAVRLAALPDELAKPQSPGADANAPVAKSAPQAIEPKAADPTAPLAPSPDRAAPPARELGPDLKGDLLRLLQAVNDLGGARAPAPKRQFAESSNSRPRTPLRRRTQRRTSSKSPFPTAASGARCTCRSNRSTGPTNRTRSAPGGSACSCTSR